MTKPVTTPVRLNRPEKLLAIGIATTMLKISPADFVRDELCDLCIDTQDVFDACVAMRDAREHDRMTAALRLMRDRKRDREAAQGRA